MNFFLSEIAFLNQVIQSLKPKEHFSIAEFDERAKKFQLFLLEKFPWVVFPDYLHIGLSHTKEILETSDSIALYSAQSKEVIFSLFISTAEK